MAEIEELTANPDADASGTVIESKLDPGRGAVVTVLVQRGTLKIGDAIVAGAHWGRVRAMSDYTGKRVKTALPAEPVEVLGFDTVPEAGEFARVVENDRRARSLAGERANRLKLEQQARRSGIKRSLATIFDQRGDVNGAQPRAQGRRVGLARGVRGRDRQAAAGGGPGLDRAAPASAASPSPTSTWRRPRTRSSWASTCARSATRAQLADREGVEIRTYSVIYRAIDELRDAMQGMLAPETVEDVVGNIEVRADLPRLEDRRDRGLHGHRRQGHARREGAPDPRRRGHPRRRDRLAAALQRRRPRGPRRASSAASCSPTTPTWKQGDTMEVYETRQVERTLS